MSLRAFGIILNNVTSINTSGIKENRKMILRRVHIGTGVKKSDKAVHSINEHRNPIIQPRGIKSFFCHKLYAKKSVVVQIIRTRIIAISKPSAGLSAN